MKKILTLLTAILLCSGMGWAVDFARGDLYNRYSFGTNGYVLTYVKSDLSWRADLVFLIDHLDSDIYIPVGYYPVSTSNTSTTYTLRSGSGTANNPSGTYLKYNGGSYTSTYLSAANTGYARVKKPYGKIFIQALGLKSTGGTAYNISVGSDSPLTGVEYNVNVADVCYDNESTTNYRFECTGQNAAGYQIRISVPLESGTTWDWNEFSGYNVNTWIKKNGTLIEIDDASGRVWTENNVKYFEVDFTSTDREVYHVTNYPPAGGDITIVAGANGQIKVEEGEWETSVTDHYSGATELTISAQGTEDYIFTQWSDGNVENPRTITVDGDATYTAQFAQGEQINISNAVLVNHSSSNWFNATGENEKFRVVFETSKALAYGNYPSSNMDWDNTHIYENGVEVALNHTMAANITKDEYNLHQWTYINALFTGTNGKVYSVNMTASYAITNNGWDNENDDLVGLAIPNCELGTTSSAGSSSDGTLWLSASAEQNGNSYFIDLQFKVAGDNIPTGIYPINHSLENGTAIPLNTITTKSGYPYYNLGCNVEMDTSDDDYYWWFIHNGTIKVVNTAGEYYVEVEGRNSYGKRVQFTMGTEPVITHTVTFKNYDGSTTLQTGDVEEGTQPTYNGETPTRAKDDVNFLAYEFAGWRSSEDGQVYTAELPDVAEDDVTYTAVYDEYFRILDNKENGDDYYAALASKVGQTINVKYERTFPAGEWAAFSLPFGYSFQTHTEEHPFKGHIYYLISAEYEVEGGKAYLTLNCMPNTLGIVANKPYVLIPNDTIVNPVFNNVNMKAQALNYYSVPCTNIGVADPVETVEFRNTLTRMQFANNDHRQIYLVGSKLRYPNDGTHIRAFRGYFYMQEGTIQHIQPRLRNVETGEIIEAAEEANTTSVETKKYIENGILIIERAGMKYDTQGHIIK